MERGSSEAFDEDIVEEEIGRLGFGEEEFGLRRSFEVEEFLDEFCDDYVVVRVSVVDDLGVGLIEVRKSGGLLDQVYEVVSLSRRG